MQSRINTYSFKRLLPSILYLEKCSFKIEIEIKNFLVKSILKEFISSKGHFQEMLKEIFQAEEKLYRSETWIYTQRKSAEEGRNENKILHFSYS